MSYIHENLNPGETVVYTTKMHRVYLFGPALVALLLLPLGFMGMWFTLPGIAFFGYFLANYLTNEFGITTSRLIIKTGWISRHTLELQLNKIEGLKVQQGAVGRMMGYGTLEVGGTGGTKERFKYIDQPVEFRKRLQEEMGRIPLALQSFPPDQASSSVDRAERACPACAERILAAARVCKHCGRDVVSA